MLEHVFSTSRAYAEEFSWQEPFAVISICDPHSAEPSLPTGNLVARLDLRFLDLPVDPLDGSVVFDAVMATNVLRFVKYDCRGVKLLLVHCEAGVSRSTAVANALGKLLGIEVRHQNAHFANPNPLVERLLLESSASAAKRNRRGRDASETPPTR
jgi:predicted protein tyrosine phosphatase